MNESTHLLNIVVPKGSNVRTTVTPPRVLKRMDYLRIMSDALSMMAIDTTLTRSDLVVMLYCLSVCDYGNEFSVPQKVVADECGISRVQVNKAFKKLCDREWLIVIRQIGRQNVYLLNPSIAFKTRAINYHELVERFDELAIGVVEDNS